MFDNAHADVWDGDQPSILVLDPVTRYPSKSESPGPLTAVSVPVNEEKTAAKAPSRT